jgi:hypothetical protein
MKRREFVERFGIGSAALLSGGTLAGAAGPAQSGPGGGHDHEPMSGALSSATVSFGQWRTDPPLNRFPNVPPAPSANQHLLIPFVATIRPGGSVMFVIAGLHQVAIYAPGTRLTDINPALTVPVTQPPVPPGVEFPPLIDDPTNRVYRGVDPTLVPLDRVETVTLASPGKYLVICAFLPHFLDNMHGFINVVRGRRDDDDRHDRR